MKTDFLKLTKLNQFVFFLIYALTFILILYKVLYVPITHDEVGTTVHYSNFSVWQIMMYPDAWPNNHILNTLLTKLFLLLFGKEQWVVRLPNLLSFLLYAFGVSRIIKTALQIESIFYIPAALLFIANPYLLDFFGLCRGYGMSVALCTLSVSYLITGYTSLNNKNIWIAFILSILACYANFTLLIFWVATTFLTWFYFFTLYRDKKSLLLKPTMVIIISCLLYAALIALPIYKMQSTNQFQYWTSSGFFNDTLLQLIVNTFYGSKFFLFLHFKIIAYLVISILVANCIYIIIRLFNSQHQFKILHQPIFAATIIILLSAIINIIQCKVLHTPNLNGRTALFFYPLFIIALVTSLGVFKVKAMLINTVLSFVISFFCIFLLVDTVSFKSVREWWFDANTFKVTNYLNKSRNSQNTSLETNWLFNPSFNFYKYTGKTPWLDLKDYNKSLVLNTSAEYYYVLAEDYKTLESRFDPVIKFDNDCWLLKKKPVQNEFPKKAELIKEKADYEALINETILKIHHDKKWLNLIKEKALKNKIPLDSMIYIDAKWMVDTYSK
jgi:hypothetical protein